MTDPNNERLFSLDFTVRDYECDLQGIVNNAVYLHYLEHARHTFMRSVGLDFAALTNRGVYLVVTRVEIDYLSSLRSDDQFTVTVCAARLSPLRMKMEQTIVLSPGGELAAVAMVYGAIAPGPGIKRVPRAEIDAIWQKLLNP